MKNNNDKNIKDYYLFNYAQDDLNYPLDSKITSKLVRLRFSTYYGFLSLSPDKKQIYYWVLNTAISSSKQKFTGSNRKGLFYAKSPNY